MKSITVALLKRNCPGYLMQHNTSIIKVNAEDFDGCQFDGSLELRRKRRFTAPPTGIIRRWPSVYCTNNKIASALRIKQCFDELLKLLYSHEPVFKRQCKNNTPIPSVLSDTAIYWSFCEELHVLQQCRVFYFATVSINLHMRSLLLAYKILYFLMIQRYWCLFRKHTWIIGAFT